MTHLGCSLLCFFEDGFSIPRTFATLASKTGAFFQLTHACRTLFGSGDDVTVSHSLADTYVHCLCLTR